MRSTVKTDHEDYRNSQLEVIVENEFGWDWNLREIELSTITTLPDQQVRDLDHVADPDRVQQYALAMEAGAILPAIVVRPYGTGFIKVDGNTREAAALLMGRTHYPAYVIDIPSGDLARELAARLNQMHGAGLTEEEARRQAEAMIEAGRPDDAIMRATLMKAPKVRQWRTEVTTLARAQKLEVAPEMTALSMHQRRVIGSKVKLDAPFTELTKLAARAKIPNTELAKLATEISEAPTEGDMLDVVERAGRQYVPIGKGEKAHVVVNEKAKRMRMVLPQVLNLAPPADVFEQARAADDAVLWERIAELAARMTAFYTQMSTPAPAPAPAPADPVPAESA